MRLLLWGVAVAIILPVYFGGRIFGTVQNLEQCSDEASYKGFKQNNLFHAQRFSLCMFLRSNYWESRRLESALRDVMSLSATPPCARVGIWKSARRGSVYRVTLHEDSSFSAEGVVDYSPSPYASDVGSGYWGETDGKLVWIHDNGIFWPPDINRIESDATDKFTLIEVNGQRTEFTKERNLETSRCPRA